MAAIFASPADAPAALCAGEEALLDAYDLEWKAIDIRMDKLRNECERMLLEYELELKQAMYVRECEELLHRQEAKHEAERTAIERELVASQEQATAAQKETQRLQQQEKERREVEEEERRQREEQEEKARAMCKQKEEVRRVEQETEIPKTKAKATAKRKQKEPIVNTQPRDEMAARPVEKPKKKAASKKTAIETPVEPPVSPPVYSPDEEDEERQPTEPPTAQEDLSGVADDDLLAILTQDNGYESEDFGDASALSLIHPESPAMLSPKRLKKKAAFEAARLAKLNAESPLRGGEAALADRLMSRIRAVSKQPLGEPEPFSDASLSPPPLLTPPPKRALKRRKTGALSPGAPLSSKSSADKLAAAAEQTTTQSDEKDAEPDKQEKTSKKGSKKAEAGEKDTEAANEPRPEPQPEKLKKTKKGVKKVVPAEDEEVASDESNQQTEAQDVAVEKAQKKKSSAPKKDAAASKAVGKPKTARKEKEITSEEHLQQEDAEDEQGEAQAEVTTQENRIGAVTGRSKARQSAKRAALQAAAEEGAARLTGFAAIHDIKTPKVPRKKMGMDGKKKQSNDLAAKRAEFQQIFNENNTQDQAEDSSETVPLAGKKRRRKDEPLTRKEPVELEFHTPKPKGKKSKITKNPFPHDELNIMKSPVPLLRAKIAEKKKKEEEEAKKQKRAKKRTASQRDDVDEEDPGYGSLAADGPTSSVLPKTQLPAPISIKPNSTQTPTRKSPDEIAAAASDYASRWLNSGLVTRAKKNAVKSTRKPATKTSPKPASAWGGGASFFDAFVNTGPAAIPRLKSTSSAPKL